MLKIKSHIKYLVKFSIFVLISSLGLMGCDTATNEKKIGIIVPIQHQAMDEIVAGFTETLKAEYPHPIKIKVANAQGDLNIERALIRQMKDEKYDVIVPIGTDASQMSVAAISKQPILSLASNLTQQDRQARKICNVAIVHDEIKTEQLLHFIHATYPSLTQLVLVHSTSDKIFPEVNNAIAIGKRLGIEIKPMMVPTLNELYSTANNIPQNAQGILVLKDHLIVSGITTLELTANKRHIPLITSDQGSAQAGATFAIGVLERNIGVEGAKLASQILLGKNPCELPIIEMTKLTVFVNKDAANKNQQSVSTLVASAKQSNYQIQYVGKEGNKE